MHRVQAAFIFPEKATLQIHEHILKGFYLLAGVSSADLTVGHGAVFGGGEVVEGFLVNRAGFLRQSAIAWMGVLQGPCRNMEVVVLLWLLVTIT